MSDSEKGVVELCSELAVLAQSRGIGRMESVTMVNIDPDINNRALVEIKLPNGKHLILDAELRDDWTQMEYFQRTDPVISQLPEELIEATKDAELRGEDIGETIESFKKPRH